MARWGGKRQLRWRSLWLITRDRAPPDLAEQRAGQISVEEACMTETDHQRFRAQLDEFSKRLDGCMRDFRERGRFTDIHRTMFEEIRQRHDQLERKLALATTTGTAWDVIRSGVERDFTVLLDGLRKAGEQLDSDEMKAR
jgi:hypothetical protein